MYLLCTLTAVLKVRISRALYEEEVIIRNQSLWRLLKIERASSEPFCHGSFVEFLPIYISLILIILSDVVWVLRSSIITWTVNYDWRLLFSHLVQLLLQVKWQVDWMPQSWFVLAITTRQSLQIAFPYQGCGCLMTKRGRIYLADL